MADLEDNAENVASGTRTADRHAIKDPYIGYEFADRYKVIELIGSGGWGNVYRARHLTLDRDVAVKVIHQHLLKDDLNAKRLEQEAKLLNSISCPYIVGVIDYGISPSPYIVMEYFDGEPLSKVLKQQALSSAEALELFLQICQGLVSAHACGFVHRDLKPANIMLKIQDSKLSCKILDFGIAKMLDDSCAGERLTATGEVIGSPPYMAPEQWAGRADHRSDIYSFACIMYEVLAGKQAFVANTGIDYMKMHLAENPAPIAEAALAKQIPPVLQQIVNKCLKKSVEQRYQSSSELLADLQQVSEGKKFKIHISADRSTVIKRISLLSLGMLSIIAICAYCQREPLLSAYCVNENKSADKERQSGKVENAMRKYDSVLAVSKYLPPQDPRILHALRMKISCLERLNRSAETIGLHQQLAGLTGTIMNSGIEPSLRELRYLRDVRADVVNADVKGDQLMKQVVQSRGKHSLAYATVLNLVANEYQNEGKFDEALRAHEESLRIAQSLEEPDSSVIIERMCSVAVDLIKEDKLTQAEQLLFKALPIAEDNLSKPNGSNSTGSRLSRTVRGPQLSSAAANLSLVCNDIGLLRVYQGKPAEALNFISKALALAPRDSSINQVPIYTNFALAYQRLGQGKAVVDSLNNAIAESEKNGTDQLPDGEIPLTQFAEFYCDTKEYAYAEKCIDEALRLRTQFDWNHPRVRLILEDAIKIKKLLGKNEQARELETKLAKLPV